MRTPLHILIAGGTGFIGEALARHRLAMGDHVAVLGRDKEKIKQCYSGAAKAISWHELHDKKRTGTFDLIINLVGANIGEKRWSKQRKREILESRIIYTEKLARLCAQLGAKSPRLLNASAIGIYGLQETTAIGLPKPLDESTTVSGAPYSDFLNEVAYKWERATDSAKEAGVNVVNLRFAVVLSPTGGVLKKLMPLYKLGLGQKIANGQQAFSWVSLQDVVNVIDFLIAHPKVSGPINIVSPECVHQRVFAQAFAKSLKRPCLLYLPKFLVKMMFGQMGEELLVRGQHIYPKRLVELEYKFLTADIKEFFHVKK